MNFNGFAMIFSGPIHGPSVLLMFIQGAERVVYAVLMRWNSDLCGRLRISLRGEAVVEGVAVKVNVAACKQTVHQPVFYKF